MGIGTLHMARRLGSAGLVLTVLLSAVACRTQTARDQEVQELRQRVAQLEARLASSGSSRGTVDAALAAEPNVRPGINDEWRSDDIGPLIGRLETESREIYTERFNLAAVVGPPPGAAVADIGAGSGFMTNIFARQVGPTGRVYAVDINAELMRHVAEGAASAGLGNVQTIVCTDRSVELPEASIDIAFICDTYHHFEYPRNSMESIRRALRPGGQVIIVDFHRIPGVTREFLLEHVRAGEEIFTREIIQSGFELMNDHDVPWLTENYVLRFRKSP